MNVCDNDLWTPLHAAATCANLEICKILIDAKADLLAVNTDGNMPYDICDHELCLEYIESEMAARGVTQQTIDLKRSEQEYKMLDDLKQVCFRQIGSYLNTSGKNYNEATNSFLIHFNQPFDFDGRLNLNAKDHNGATLVSLRFIYLETLLNIFLSFKALRLNALKLYKKNVTSLNNKKIKRI